MTQRKNRSFRRKNMRGGPFVSYDTTTPTAVKFISHGDTTEKKYKRRRIKNVWIKNWKTYIIHKMVIIPERVVVAEENLKNLKKQENLKNQENINTINYYFKLNIK